MLHFVGGTKGKISSKDEWLDKVPLHHEAAATPKAGFGVYELSLATTNTTDAATSADNAAHSPHAAGEPSSTVVVTFNAGSGGETSDYFSGAVRVTTPPAHWRNPAWPVQPPRFMQEGLEAMIRQYRAAARAWWWALAAELETVERRACA